MKKRSEIAYDYFCEGYNCAQAVFASYCDITGCRLEEALRISAPFGAGLSRLRLTCGAVFGASMVIGVLYGHTEPIREKCGEVYAIEQEFCRRFEEKLGTLSCMELLKIDPDSSPHAFTPMPSPRDGEYKHSRPCYHIIPQAVEILDGLLEEIGNKE